MPTIALLPLRRVQGAHGCGCDFHVALGRDSISRYRERVAENRCGERFLRHSQVPSSGALLFLRALFGASDLPGKGLTLGESAHPLDASTQWIKNGFVFLGLVFGHGWGDASLVAEVLALFASFCWFRAPYTS